MKKYLYSFSVVLPIAELLLAAGLILVLTLVFFFRLKYEAHGLSFAFFRAAAAASKTITVLNAPASFVELIMSLLRPPLSGTWYSTASWHPAWLRLWPGRSLTYPIYALPAWFYVGHGVNSLQGRRRIGTANIVLSLVLTGMAIVVCCLLRFGLSPTDQVSLLTAGFALWACLFALPLVAWLRQNLAGTAC